MKRPYLLLACLSPVACLMAASGQKGGKNKQKVNDRQLPNVVFIYADDLGYGDLSCQGAAKDIQTPHIDKLLNEGVRFTNFHANCPVSSPSRASLLTGRYPDMVGVPGVIRTHKEDSWGYLSEDAVLLPQMLKKRGYHNAMVGKWNLGLESPNTPTERVSISTGDFRGYDG